MKLIQKAYEFLRKQIVHLIAPLVATAIVLAYWGWVRPNYPGPIGFAEDLCTDIVRQMMASILTTQGHPQFFTDQFMTPQGASIPFMSWSTERDWLGAYAWLWNRDFPFLWVYFGMSLLGACLGVGFILRKMGLSKRAAWGLAALVVVFHTPRHFKIYHHYEHLLLHWIYWSIFLDALIWQRFIKEKRWSLHLEGWRAFCLLGVTGTTGYFWGPMVMEWVLVRSCILAVICIYKYRKNSFKFEFKFLSGLTAITFGFVLLALSLRWFIPLIKEVENVGPVWQLLSWHAKFSKVIEPLWLSWIIPGISPLDTPETVVTIGWIFWIPVCLGLYFLSKRRGGPGIITVLPFLLFLFFALLYLRHGPPFSYPKLVQTYVPFMNYFRVASRMGLFLPMIAGVIIALCFPVLQRWFQSRMSQARTQRNLLFFRGAVAVFIFLSTLEFARMVSTPVNAMPPMDPSLARMLTRLRESPGTTIIDMPFCVAGGNGICTDQQCPNYPRSTVGQCLRVIHDKKIHGLYQSRMTEAHCQIYNRAPYVSWFQAWREQRCLTDTEWSDFCKYLSEHPEFAGILYYPDIWHGAEDPTCKAAFKHYLGDPIDEASSFVKTDRFGQWSYTMRVKWYAPKCQTGSWH